MGLTRWAVTLVAALGVVMGSATAALAHVVEQSGYVWENLRGYCLGARSEISHGGGGGYTRSHVEGEKPLNGPGWTINCYAAWQQPPGELAVRTHLYFWTGSQWIACRTMDWRSNAITDDQVHQTRSWSKPCGNGYYGSYANGRVWHDNSWKGGWMWSGHHFIPA